MSKHGFDKPVDEVKVSLVELDFKKERKSDPNDKEVAYQIQRRITKKQVSIRKSNN